MNPIFKKSFLAAVLILLIFQLSGCGETLQGISKDAQRMGKGVKTIFIRDGE